MADESRCMAKSRSARSMLVQMFGWSAVLFATGAGAEMPAPPAAPRIALAISAPAGRLEPASLGRYTVVAENSGGSPQGARLLVSSPQGLSNRSWRCVASRGASCAHATGNGDLDEALQGLVAGGRLEFSIDADVGAAPPAFVRLLALASLPAGSACAAAETPPCRSTLLLPTGANLDLDVQSSATALAPGQRVAYTIRVDAADSRTSTSGTVLRSPVPRGLVESTWTCQSGRGACAAASGTGDINQVLGDFSGGEVTFVVTSKVAASPPGKVVQSVVAVPPYGGSCSMGRQGAAVASSPCTARLALATRPWILVSRTPDYSADGFAVANRFVLENRGSSAGGSHVALELPDGVASLSWTCTGHGATCAQDSGNGPIHQTIANWPASGRLQFDVLARRSMPLPGSSGLRMAVTPPSGGVCGISELQPPCDDLAAPIIENGFLSISQVVDRLGARAGDEVNFTIVVGNDSAGASARDVVLDMPLPAGIESFASWSCDAGDSPGHCPTASGSGPLHQLIPELAPSARLVYSLAATVGPSPPSIIISQARLETPAESSLGCRSQSGSTGPCVATVELSSVPVLALEQSRLEGNLSSGGSADYTLEVFNFGADASDVRIDNGVPTGFSSASWVCTGLGIGCPASSGHGKVTSVLGSMPAGSGLQYRITGRVAEDPPPSISTVLMALPSAGGRCHRSASDPLSATPCVDRVETGLQPFLALSQSAAEHQLLAGGVAHYLLELKNLGSPANGALLNVPLPDGVERFDWTCTGFAGAVCPRTSASGAIDEAIAAMPSDSSVSYSIRAVLGENAPASISAVATATPPAGGHCADDCAATTELPVATVPAAHLDVQLKSARAWAPANSDPVWTIDVRNLGAEVANDFQIANPLPGDGLSIVSWTCAGIECPAAEGVGPISQSVKSLAVYDPDSGDRPVAAGRLVFTVVGHVDSHPGAEARLTADLTPAPGDTCAPVSCEAVSALPTELLGGAEVTLDLQADTFTAVPNSTINYTFTISASSGLGVIDVPAFSVEPPEIASSTWTCVASGGATCNSPSGSGPINELLTGMPDGSTVTFSVAAQTGSNVQPSVDYLVGVNVTSPILCVPVSCTVPLSIPGEDQLTLTLDADVSQIVPGGSVQYTYRVENTGGGDQFGINLFTVEPPEFIFSSWTCVATGKAFCSPSGSGPILDLISFIPRGSTITYTIDAVAASTLPPSVDFQGGAEFGGQPRQPSAPDGVLGCVPASCLVTLSLPSVAPPPARLSISKTADRSTLDPGGNVRYTINIANSGTEEATAVQFSDAIPNGLSSFAWTCSSTGDISCPQNSGTGSINQTISFLPIDSSLTYTVDATVSATASGTVNNRAQLVGSNITCAPSSCQAVSALPVGQAPVLAVSKTANPASGTPVGAGQPIAWTVLASNSGGPTRAALVLTDTLPSSVAAISVQPDNGVTCNTLAPMPGSTLTCTVAAGFVGQRGVQISATVAANASGAVVNTVDASGSDNPACTSCTVSNPVAQAVDVAIANARPFSAAGIPGTLIDIANMSSVGAAATTVTVSPGSALRLFAAYAGGCTATAGAGGSISVSCPNPPSAQGIACSGSACTLASLPSNSAATLFVALNTGATATITAVVPGDADPTDNTIVLPIGGTP